MMDSILLGIDGKDNYNKEIRKAQAKGIVSVTQKIRDNYLSNSSNQKMLTISIKQGDIQLKNLGDKYELDINNIFNQIPFYKHVLIGSFAMLGKVVRKLNTNYLECTFYFHGEQQ